MRKLLPALLLPLLCLAAPLHAQNVPANDSEYLQRRALELNERINSAVQNRHLTRKKAAKLYRSVGQVQTLAGNLETRNGTIERSDADRMNQQLTDVERTLTRQP